MSHKGQIFEQEISRSIRECEGTWYYKFPQMRKVIHPFDHLVITNNNNYAIEEKKIKDSYFPLDNLKDKQEKSLLWFQKLDRNISFIFINYRQGRGDIRAFGMTIEEYLRAKNQMIEEIDRKSIPIEYCENEKRIFELERIKLDEQNYGWDLSFL